jgi:hypothetical protein
MQADQLPDAVPKSFVYLVGHGLAYGVAAGILSAEIYIGATTALMFIAGGYFSGLAAWLILGQIYGVLPAAIVGAVSGVIIGTAFYFLRDELTAKTGWLWALLIAVPMTVPFAVLLLAGTANTDKAAALVIGVPIVVLYLASAALGGKKLAGGSLSISSAQRTALLCLLAVVVGLVLARAAFSVLVSIQQLFKSAT